MTRMVVIMGLLAAACGDSKRKPPWPPLLGMQSKATVTRFEAACDERFAPVDKYAEKYGEPKQYAHLSATHVGSMGETHICEMSGGQHFFISFFLGAVSHIDIIAMTETEKLEIFDRAFAASLPDNIRDAMRRSILDPTHFEFVTANGGVFVEPSGSAITWRTASRDEVLMKPAFDRARAERPSSTAGGSDKAH